MPDKEFFDSPDWLEVMHDAEELFFQLCERIIVTKPKNWDEFCYLSGRMDQVLDVIQYEKRFIPKEDKEAQDKFAFTYWERLKGVLRRFIIK